ncbi:MAG: glycosyltransferase family 4 protein [Firmicutes bacterium]|nr:glycosyltransferase family 4 protein [Bacillota bacterium]
MNIGVFSDSYRPYVSGVVTSIETFTQELNSLGHSVYIFAPRYPNYVETNPNIFRFLSVRPPTNPDFSLAVPISPRLGYTIKRLQLDIIHVHSPFLLGRLGARYARRYRIPLVFTYHTLYDQYVHYVPFGQRLTRDLMVHWSRHFCNQCDLVITPSSKVKELLRQYGVKVPIKVLPTGINVDKFATGDSVWVRQRYHLNPKTKILLFVGRLGKEKNVDFLLYAYRQVVDHFPDSVLLIVARGPEEQAMRDLARELGLGERVIFTGFLQGNELVNCYHGADLFVFPSVTETQGLVLVEAMAARLPVVAINAFGVADMVSHGLDGLLTEQSLTAFSSAIIELLQDDARRAAMKEQAWLKAQRLSSRNMTLELVRVYQHLIDLRKRNDYATGS